MKTSGLFTTHAYTIPVKSLNEEIPLVLFGDIHRDSPNHANGAWQSFLQYARKLKGAYFLGLGDYLDSTSTSERECLEITDHKLHETLKKDLVLLQEKKVELLESEMGFMRGRLIGLLNGNHYFQFRDGGNTDQRLCQALDTTYLGVSTFIRLSFIYGTGIKTLDIWAHHGAGSGRLPGGSINRVDQMREMATADVYIMGHDHKRIAVPATPRLYLQNTTKGGLKVRHQQQWLVRSGSFLASYEPGVVNYNVDNARGSCSLGHVELIVTPTCNRDEADERKPGKRPHGYINELKIHAKY